MGFRVWPSVCGMGGYMTSLEVYCHELICINVSKERGMGGEECAVIPERKGWGI